MRIRSTGGGVFVTQALRYGREAGGAPLPRLASAPFAVAIFYEVMSRVTVYTTEPCSFCAKVKGLLRARGVEFAEINLSKDPDGRAQHRHDELPAGDRRRRADRRLHRGAGRRREWAPGRAARRLNGGWQVSHTY